MKIEISESALKDIKRLDKQIARKILSYLKEIEKLEDPTSKGKALSANLSGLWRYRIGDYRIICSIENDRLVVLVLRIGHRREIYR